MRRTGKIALLFLMTAVAASAQTITVAAAADLKFALTELAGRFEHSTGNKVEVTTGASGNLYSQIANGAPFDLFFSADEEYPKRLVESGKAETASLHIYAVGHLVLWVPGNSPFDPGKTQIGILTEPAVKRIAIANPQHAPYGRAAMAVLEHYGLKSKVEDKLVQGESVSQAAQFVQSGNAQAGLIALSLAKSPAMETAGKYWEVPLDAYPEIRQAVVLMSSSRQKTAAQAFLDFVLSAEGAAVLKKFGLAPPTHS
jgi:molybdate transport system substrate-binding protein